MQGYKVEILAPAWAELEEIADYHLMMVGPASAKKITDQIISSIEQLGTYPLIGIAIKDDELGNLGYRVLASGEYICIYRIIGDTVYIYHIVHGSRDYPRLFKA